MFREGGRGYRDLQYTPEEHLYSALLEVEGKVRGYLHVS